MGNEVNICYITDDNYVQHTLVSMASLVSSKFPATNYRITIICDHVSPELKATFPKFRQKGVHVELLDYANRTYEKQKQEVGKYISSSTYIRLKLPSILKNIDRVLYLDGDVIVQDDLSELFNIDLENAAVAGSIDFGMCIESDTWKPVEYIRKTLPDYKKHYVNAGVLLFNLDELRKIGFEDICEKIYRERTDFIFADQDIINFALIGRKKIFPLYWNCPILSLSINYNNLTDRELRRKVAKIYHLSYASIMDLAFSSSIIHINGSKEYIAQIPFIKALYERNLRLALEYMKRNKN